MLLTYPGAYETRPFCVHWKDQECSEFRERRKKEEMRGSGQPNLKLKSSLFQKHQCWYRIRANYNNLLLSLNTSFRITFAKLSR